MSTIASILRTCAAIIVLLLGDRVLGIGTAVSSDAGAELIEVSSHHFSAHRPSAERSGHVMRRQAAQEVDFHATQSDAIASAWGHASKEPTPAQASAGVTWGAYNFVRSPGTQQCNEEGVKTWEGNSFFKVWAGTDTNLTTRNGTQVQNGVITETPKALCIYKAGCPSSTTLKVGGVMTVPAGSMSIDLVFGITRQCTGDSAHFMVTLLKNSHSEDEDVVHRWCWNKQGNNTEVQCDESDDVPFFKWNRVLLNISNYMDYATPLKVALEVYCNLPTLPGEHGPGGRAMTLVDTLIFGPAERPVPDSAYATPNSGVSCRQAMRDVCLWNSWCMDKYRCLSGYCTEGKSRCNSVRNCEDDSDEVGCEYHSGFRAEFYLHHARHLGKLLVNIDDLKNPDIRTFIDKIDFNVDDFYQAYHARDNFAAKFMGNFSIHTGGKYQFGTSSGAGDFQLQIRGREEGNKDQTWNITAKQWIDMDAGNYEMKITYIHLTTGVPSIVVDYFGPDTKGSSLEFTKDLVSSTLIGARCDTMQCNTGDGLVPKPGYEKLMCASVPCVEEVDTTTCCTREYMTVAAGDHRTCALDTLGRPICWGSWKGFEEEWKQHPGPYIDISTRAQYVCAVLADTKMVDCWMPDHASAPLVQYSDGRFTNISVGGDHTCALRDSGIPACTGSGVYSQTNPPSNLEFTQLSSGKDFTCGITTIDKTVKCWGANEKGQATPPGYGPSQYTYTDLGAGETHACGISNGTAVCWGWNSDGQAAPPTGPQYADFTQIAAGTVHSCALRRSGQAVCWPDDLPQSNVPQGDAPFLMISTGKAHTCAIRGKDNEVVCWGSNFETSIEGQKVWRGQSEAPPAGIWPFPLALAPVVPDIHNDWKH